MKLMLLYYRENVMMRRAANVRIHNKENYRKNNAYICTSKYLSKYIYIKSNFTYIYKICKSGQGSENNCEFLSNFF